MHRSRLCSFDAARTLTVVGAALALAAFAAGCPTGTPDAGDSECTRMATCGDVETVCDGCPPLGDVLCLEGTCTERGGDAVDVTATVSIEPRQLIVTSLVYALASMTTGTGPLTCGTAVSADGIADAVNVLATGYKALSGGSFHPDVGVGRSPEGDIALLLLGTDGAGGGGDIIATGCRADLQATGTSLTIDLVTLEGL
jgi:hypothetical protein